MSAVVVPSFDKDGTAGIMEWCKAVKEVGKSEGVEVTARDLVITARKDFPSEDVPAVVKCIKELYKDEYTQDAPKLAAKATSKPPVANKAPAKASKPSTKGNGKESPPKASKAPVKAKNGKDKESSKPTKAKTAKKAVAKGDAKVVPIKNKTGLDVKLLKLPSGVTQATIEGFSLRPAIRGMAAAGMENKAIKTVFEKAGLFDKGVNPVGAKMSFDSVINDHGASGRSFVSTKGKKFWHGKPAELGTKLVAKLKALAK